jgi:hypothetical protein
MGAVAQAVGYALMCWGGPFVLFVLAYIPIGFGLGLQGQSSPSTRAGLFKREDLTNRRPGQLPDCST